MNDFLVVHIFINDLCCREICKLLKMCSFGNLCGKVARIQTRTYVSIHILGNVCFITGIMWRENMNLFKTDSVWFSSVTQSCSTLGDHIDCSTPGFPVHHQLTELAQTHVHWVGDAIQPSHPLSSPSLSTFNLSQHQGLFKWVSSLHQVAKVLEFQL